MVWSDLALGMVMDVHAVALTKAPSTHWHKREYDRAKAALDGKTATGGITSDNSV